MAGQDIYLGKMIENLNTKLDSTITTLQELNNIKSLISTSVQSLKTKPSDIAKGTINTADSPVITSTTKTPIYKIRSFCDGVIRIKGTFFGNVTFAVGATVTGTLCYSLDKGVTWIDITSLSMMQNIPGTDKPFSVDVLSNGNGEIWLGIYTSNANFRGMLKSGATVCYDILDIVNEGGFVSNPA